ncbi:ABC transporter substrate-binding protein [Streptomyces sp. NPDC091272]|uniref:ABC transporter substrate-binding protein n=1 Tax=Streptomyces sp. NPDC091272 TaxID=3365981 RepID=UPI00381BCB98
MRWPRRNRERRSGWMGELPPWWRRYPGNAICIVLAVALLGGGLSWLLWPDPPEDTSCATGVERVESECVGVTDGSYSFGDGDGEGGNLAGVFGRIRTENDAVNKATAKKDGPSHVSVVYLMSMVPRAKNGDTNTPDSVRHEIQGAHTAQMEANHSGKYGDLPKIKLLLAHVGNSAAQADAVLAEIRDRVPGDRIVAVAGLGTSTVATEGLIRRLTGPKSSGGLQLAAVGSVLTADTLKKVPGLVRVAPVNSDEASAAAAFLQQKEYAKKRVLVVQDEKPDDQYTKTLGQGFLRAFPASRLAAKTETYDSSQDGVGTAFKTRMSTICAARPDVIFFAGRGTHLPAFLAPLKDRPCAKERQVLVVSGDDASQSAQADGFQDIKDTLRDGNVRLVYTGLAHPESWSLRPDAYPGASKPSFGPEGRFHQLFKEEALDDGQAIMGHDAVLTAVAGIRLVAKNSNTNNGLVSGSEVIQIWRSLHGRETVLGASGLISLDNEGSPERKAVPLIEIRADGSVHTLAVSAQGGKPLTLQELGE